MDVGIIDGLVNLTAFIIRGIGGSDSASADRCRSSLRCVNGHRYYYLLGVLSVYSIT